MKWGNSKVVSIIGAVVGFMIARAVIESNRRDEPLSFYKALVQTSNKINAKLPMQVDNETRLDATVVGPGNRLTYLYTLTSLSSDDVNVADLTAALKPRLVDGYRTSVGMAAFRRAKVELYYQYRDKDSNSLTTIVVSPKDF
jgi:hypothetical protein